MLIIGPESLGEIYSDIGPCDDVGCVFGKDDSLASCDHKVVDSGLKRCKNLGYQDISAHTPGSSSISIYTMPMAIQVGFQDQYLSPQKLLERFPFNNHGRRPSHYLIAALDLSCRTLVSRPGVGS
jgi:hypothetical protein